MEEIKKTAKMGKILNILLIIFTLIYFASSWILEFLNDYNTELILSLVLLIVSIVILIFAIISMVKMRKLKIDGGGLLLASSIVFFIFTFFGFLLGIVILVLSGSSIRKIKESLEILEIENE